MNLSELAELQHIENQRLASRLDLIEAKLDDIRGLVGPFAVPMPDGNMLVQTLHGIKYLIDPKDLIMAPQLIVYRQWEPDLTTYFCSQFTSDTVFVDVGANFGYFTCLAGAKIGNSGNGRIVSVEPNPELFKLLKANCAINWSMCDITLNACALGDRSGSVDLWIPEDRAANASLSSATGGKKVVVDLRSLDSLLCDLANIDILKIDVEGHEASVLRGAKSVIARSQNIRIVLEWSQAQMHDAGVSVSDMLQLFQELRLRVFALPDSHDRLQQPRHLDDLFLQSTPYTNILLMH